MTVAALYVDPNGVYANLPDVEVWDEARDARRYAGPWPVVAHPPCTRWCMLARGIETRFGYQVGDDGGTFAAALAAVREFGGVLEHPAHSLAWDAYDLPVPVTPYAWTFSLFDGGASCYVEQGRYGLPMRKATWLYAYGVDLPELEWGFKPPTELGEFKWGGYLYASAAMRDRPRLPGNILAATPVAFRDVLLEMARTARRTVAA